MLTSLSSSSFSLFLLAIIKVVTSQSTTTTSSGGALDLFTYFPGTSMASIVIPALTAYNADSCGRACLSSPGCTSFQWYTTSRVCFTSTTLAPRNATKGADLYVLKKRPASTTVSPAVGGCREGQILSSCLLDPCLLASCPAYPNSFCIADRCNGCTARFVDKSTVKWIPTCDSPKAGAAVKSLTGTTVKPTVKGTTVKPVKAATTPHPAVTATTKPTVKTTTATTKPTVKATATTSPLAPRPTVSSILTATSPTTPPLVLQCPINYNVTIPANQGDTVYQYGATLTYQYPFLNANPPAGIKTYRTGPDTGGVFRLGNNTVTFLMKTDDNSVSVSCTFVIWIIVQQDPLLAANMNNPGVFNTSDGLQYHLVTPGTGLMPTAADTVIVNYQGSLMNGTIFDTTAGKTPATFQVSKVVPGYSEALMMMKEGGTLEVWIPYYLAYGAQGYPPIIPPSAPLHFIIQLLQVKRAGQ